MGLGLSLATGEGRRAAHVPSLHLSFLTPNQEEERGSEASNEEEDPKDKALPEDPETCLQLNMVYQEVIREKLAEVSQLLAQNQEQQVRMPIQGLCNTFWPSVPHRIKFPGQGSRVGLLTLCLAH